MESLGVAWLPGLVFLALAVWLVKKAIKAARTERDLEEDRLAAAARPDAAPIGARPTGGPMPDPGGGLKPRLSALATPPRAPATFACDDTGSCSPEHLALIGEVVAGRERSADPGRTEVLWARSAGECAAWCERRKPAGPAAGPPRDVLCVIRVRDGRIVDRWTHGG